MASDTFRRLISFIGDGMDYNTHCSSTLNKRPVLVSLKCRKWRRSIRMKHIKLIMNCFVLLAITGCASNQSLPSNHVTKSVPAKTVTVNRITFVNNTTTAKTNKNGEPLICKEFKKTGTRLKTITECRTSAEWDYLKQRAKDEIKNMYLKLGSDHG